MAAFHDCDFSACGLLPPPARMSIPGMPSLVSLGLEKAAAAHPEREALVGRYARFTFAELVGAVNAGAAALLALGVEPGDRVAATARNDPDMIIAFHAVQRIGAIWVGINRQLSPSEKIHQLNDCGVSVYLADAATGVDIASRRAELPELKHILSMEPSDIHNDWRQMIAVYAAQKPASLPLDPFAPAAIGYTSGTTGFPKGAVHSQHNMMVVAAAGIGQPALRHGCTMQLTVLNAMINHGLTLLTRGATVVCVDPLDAGSIVAWIEREALEGFRAPPAVVYDLLTKPELKGADLSRLNYVGVGGAAPSEKLRRLYQARFGHDIGCVYGLTEAPSAVTYLAPNEEFQSGAAGRALPHLDVRILNEQDQEVPLGETGQICVRAIGHGPWADVYTPMLGYWRQPEATRKTLHGGWLHTGDIGHADASGMIFIGGRSTEMILRGGANVYPAEVERVLLQDARVREAFVLGVPDERLGEAVIAVIETGGIADVAGLTADLKAKARGELARYKQPDRYVVRPDLPRNAMGKVERHKLRAQLLTELGGHTRDAEKDGTR